MNWTLPQSINDAIIKKDCTNCNKDIATYFYGTLRLMSNRLQKYTSRDTNRSFGLKFPTITLDDAGMYYSETNQKDFSFVKTGMKVLLVLGRYQTLTLH